VAIVARMSLRMKSATPDERLKITIGILGVGGKGRLFPQPLTIEISFESILAFRKHC
jgi:hypothetical protein